MSAGRRVTGRARGRHGRPKGQMQLPQHVDDEKGRRQVVYETPATDENEYRAEPTIFERQRQKASETSPLGIRRER